MDAMDGSIARYHLNDTTPEAAGQFTIPALQTLYDELVTFGSESLENALLVGVLVEEADIADLNRAIKATKERPITRVLNNLLSGSNNHLDAFHQALSRL